MINFGIVGCGRIASRHAQSIFQLKEAHLTAAADIVSTRAEKFEKEYGSQAYMDYRRILERDDIDVVNICTPSGLHARMTIEALLAGKHVIVEKPMALTLEDANQMIATSQATGKKLCVVLQNRFNPPMQDLRHIVDQGKLGKLLLGNATIRWFRPQEYYEDSWHGTWAMDGGALMNQSIHHIDALQWFLGDVESVFAYTATLAHNIETEDTGVAVVRFKSGALGCIEGSTITYPQNLEGSIALFGEKGSVKVGGIALNRKEFWKVEGELEHERERLTQEQLDHLDVYGSSHQIIIADMIRAIEEDRAPQTDGREARKSLALVLAIYESARTGQPVACDETLIHQNN
jgi:predicted dehydrogenase